MREIPHMLVKTQSRVKCDFKMYGWALNSHTSLWTLYCMNVIALTHGCLTAAENEIECVGRNKE